MPASLLKNIQNLPPLIVLVAVEAPIPRVPRGEVDAMPSFPAEVIVVVAVPPTSRKLAEARVVDAEPKNFCSAVQVYAVVVETLSSRKLVREAFTFVLKVSTVSEVAVVEIVAPRKTFCS